MEYSHRRNLNRGYMKLEVWQRGMDLFRMAFSLALRVHDLKLRSQFADATQSAAANVAEGYGRRSLQEYIQFLYTAKGSLGESLTRAAGLWRAKVFSDAEFEEFDKLHYEVENKLLALIESLEAKRGTGEWVDSLPRHHTAAPSTRTTALTLPSQLPADAGDFQKSSNPPLH
jgi:four helix bundle protein